MLGANPEDDMARHAGRNRIRPFPPLVVAAVLAAALPAAIVQNATAQDAARPAVRQVAPDVIPVYPGAAAADAPPLPEIVLPTPERPLGNCDAALPRARFGQCLQRTLDLSRRTLESTVAAARAKVEGRADLPAGYRERWSKLLAEVQERWKEARNLECGQLRPLERGPSPRVELFEERSACLLATDAARTAELKRRYGLP